MIYGAGRIMADPQVRQKFEKTGGKTKNKRTVAWAGKSNQKKIDLQRRKSISFLIHIIIFVYVYTFMYNYTSIHMYTYIYIHHGIYIRMQVYMYTYIYTSV